MILDHMLQFLNEETEMWRIEVCFPQGPPLLAWRAETSSCFPSSRLLCFPLVGKTPPSSSLDVLKRLQEGILFYINIKTSEKYIT